MTQHFHSFGFDKLLLGTQNLGVDLKFLRRAIIILFYKLPKLWTTYTKSKGMQRLARMIMIFAMLGML